MWSSSPSLLVLLFAALGGLQGVRARCAWSHEDCSHTGCCEVQGHTCFKKNDWWAACLASCKKGVHHEEPAQFRQPWSCEVVERGHRDCAAHGDNCAHLGCCKDPGSKCHQKNAHWAGCRTSCQKGEANPEDPAAHRTPWSCEEISVHETGSSGAEYEKDGGRSTKEEVAEIKKEVKDMSGGHGEDLSQGWRNGLQATHYWDCNGAHCDACLLQPWDQKEFKYAPHYAPTDPDKHGGALYGEKLWLTGAASDKLTELMGPDTDCCGADGAGAGGCGQCLLLKVPESNHPDWLAVIMKKNRCPPHSYGCDKVHLDVAVPGFDNLQYSTANVCGGGSRSDTYIEKHHSAICGSTSPAHCNCEQLPADTPAQRQLRDGCLLFKSWGWHGGTPLLDYRPVPCPRNFVDWVRVGSAFGPAGVLELAETWNATATAAVAASSPSSPLRPPPERLSTAMLGGLAAAGAAVGGLALGLRLRRSRQRAGLLLLLGSEADREAAVGE